MPNINNAETRTNEEVLSVKVIDFVCSAKEILDSNFYDDEFPHFHAKNVEFYAKTTSKCLEMPKEFYEGSLDFIETGWEETSYMCYDKQYNDTVSLDELLKNLYIDGPLPTNAEELRLLAEEFRTKKKFYHLVRWLKWYSIESADVKADIEFGEPLQKNSVCEWITEVTNKYGEKNLHIEDFWLFGSDYMEIVALDLYPPNLQKVQYHDIISLWHTTRNSDYEQLNIARKGTP